MTCQITCARDDGGRAAAGFMPAGGVDDCVTRALAIATETPYAEVRAELGRIAGNRRAPDLGLDPEVSQRYLEARGWVGILNRLGSPRDEWHATMRDLPPGRYVLVQRDAKGDGHFMAFITDGQRGELRDMDSRRGLWRLEDWLPHPPSGWWTKDPQMPRRPADRMDAPRRRQPHGKQRKRR